MQDNNYFLEGLLNNDEKIIHEIYDICFPKTRNFIFQNRGQQSDAEDIFQKALLQIMARVQVRKFEINSSFEAYIFVACRNLWRRELNIKKKWVTDGLLVEQHSDERELALSLVEQERWEFFQEKLDEISDNCKEILKRFFNKLPYAVIAEELKYTNEAVVRQRVFKCKNKLAGLIKADIRFNQLREL